MQSIKMEREAFISCLLRGEAFAARLQQLNKLMTAYEARMRRDAGVCVCPTECFFLSSQCRELKRHPAACVPGLFPVAHTLESLCVGGLGCSQFACVHLMVGQHNSQCFSDPLGGSQPRFSSPAPWWGVSENNSVLTMLRGPFWCTRTLRQGDVGRGAGVCGGDQRAAAGGGAARCRWQKQPFIETMGVQKQPEWSARMTHPGFASVWLGCSR